MNTDKTQETPRGRGRPPKSPDEKKRQLSVYLSPDIVRLLARIDSNPSLAIEALAKKNITIEYIQSAPAGEAGKKGEDENN